MSEPCLSSGSIRMQLSLIEDYRMVTPCLTLHAHWAAAIFHLGKNVENRTWSTPYRGPLAIHAGLKFDPLICLDLGLDPDKVVRGAILGTVDLIDIVRDSDSRWAMPRHFHWMLENPRLLSQSKPHSGRQSLHDVIL